MKKNLEDRQAGTGTKLALFWTALMFFYIYNDIFSMFQPGHVAELADGTLGGIQFTQPVLVAAALLMSLPGLMVILSLLLKANANRIVNIVFGIFHILVLIATQFMGETASWVYWRLYEIIEVVILVLITVTAFRWPAAGE